MCVYVCVCAQESVRVCWGGGGGQRTPQERTNETKTCLRDKEEKKKKKVQMRISQCNIRMSSYFRFRLGLKTEQKC